MTRSTTAAPVPATAPQNRVLSLWRFFAAIPGGRTFFDRMFDHRVPYAGTIDKRVVTLRAGYCRLVMRDERAVRNHRDVVHAAAILNLAETASGLALQSLLPNSLEPVIQSTTFDHRKTARGPLAAECQIDTLAAPEDVQGTEVLVRNRQNEIVAEVTVAWKLSRIAIG